MSAEKELRRLQQQLQDYQQENQNLQHEVKKWSQYCAYVAGASIGIILFLEVSKILFPHLSSNILNYLEIF